MWTRPWTGLAVLALPTLLVSMDMSVLHLAVPALSADLRPSAVEQLWIVDAYAFLVAGSLITMGTLGDRIGRRRLLLAGSAGFAAASVLAAFAPTAELLVLARGLLGVAGAAVLPSTLALIRTMFADPVQRATAFGVWVAVFTAGGALGPVIGGAVLETFWWGAVFLLGLPAMAVLLVAGPALLPESRDPEPGRLDLPSAGLSLLAVLGLVYGLKRLAADGPVPAALVALAAGALLGTVFLRRQRTLRIPLVDLGLFARPAFVLALVAMLLGLATWSGTYLLLTQYLQLVTGLSPLVTGLWLLPGVAAGILTSTLLPRLPVRRDVLLAAALGGSALGCVLLAAADGAALVVAGGALLNGVTALVVALGTDLVVGAAPEERSGAASSISETSAELGIALGVALLGSAGVAGYRASLTVPPGTGDDAAAAARETLGGALAVADGDPGSPLAAAAREAFTDGLHVAAVLGALVTALAAVAVLDLGRRRRAEA